MNEENKEPKKLNLIQNLIGSFNTKQGDGFAARKLSAFLCFMLAVYVHYKCLTPENALNFLYADFFVGLLLLSIITVQDVIKLKNGNNDNSGISEKN